MEKYWIQIGGQSNVPFTKEEIFTRFAGRLSADTPCARIGENRWGKLGEYFPDWQAPDLSAPAASSRQEMAAAEPAPQSERYGALRLMGTLYQILAWLVGAASLVSIVVGIGLAANNALGWILILYGLIGGFFGVLTNLALAQVIALLLDIEKNTRKEPAPPL